MTYTILTAAYADQHNGSALMTTEEAGLVLISAVDTPDEWAELIAWGVSNQIAAYTPPDVTASSYRLYKSVFISRLDEETNEPEMMEATLTAAPAKLRLLFNSVEYFVSDDPLFYDLYEAIASTLGPYRAKQLLEPQIEPR